MQQELLESDRYDTSLDTGSWKTTFAERQHDARRVLPILHTEQMATLPLQLPFQSVNASTVVDAMHTFLGGLDEIQMRKATVRW